MPPLERDRVLSGEAPANGLLDELGQPLARLGERDTRGLEQRLGVPVAAEHRRASRRERRGRGPREAVDAPEHRPRARRSGRRTSPRRSRRPALARCPAPAATCLPSVAATRPSGAFAVEEGREPELVAEDDQLRPVRPGPGEDPAQAGGRLGAPGLEGGQDRRRPALRRSLRARPRARPGCRGSRSGPPPCRRPPPSRRRRARRRSRLPRPIAAVDAQLELAAPMRRRPQGALDGRALGAPAGEWTTTIEPTEAVSPRSGRALGGRRGSVRSRRRGRREGRRAARGRRRRAGRRCARRR